jgi:undecaprenyl-diphosphatase
MNIAQSIILGAVQGATEFLPVSSSGHLVILQHLCGLEQRSLLLESFLHGGTLIAILIAFRQDVLRILSGLTWAISSLFKRKGLREIAARKEIRLVLFLIVASVPAAVIGILFASKVEELCHSVTPVALSLILSGTWIFVAERCSAKKNGNKEMNWAGSMTIGLAQAGALMPGISRSGATIGAGLLYGVERQDVVRFSFLLSVPAVAGALILEMWRAGSSALAAEGGIAAFTAGTLTATIVGLIAIKLVLGAVRRKKLFLFSLYCWAIGLLALILNITGRFFML